MALKENFIIEFLRGLLFIPNTKIRDSLYEDGDRYHRELIKFKKLISLFRLFFNLHFFYEISFTLDGQSHLYFSPTTSIINFNIFTFQYSGCFARPSPRTAASNDWLY